MDVQAVGRPGGIASPTPVAVGLAFHFATREEGKLLLVIVNAYPPKARGIDIVKHPPRTG